MEENPIEDVFPGFCHPSEQQGYTQLPHEFIEELHKIDSLTELKVILYILRHTWGYQEFDTPKKLTVDEFVYGRKRRDGSRIDNGTGLSDRGVKDGIAKALRHGYIICDIDDRDKGRIKKCYGIRIYREEEYIR